MNSHVVSLIAIAVIFCTTHKAQAAGPCSPPANTAPSAVVEAALTHLPASPELETGAMGNAVVGQLVEVACTETARPWLPGMCASPTPRGIIEIRQRLVADIARLTTKSIERYAQTSPEALIIARTTLAVTEALLTDGSIKTLAKNLSGNLCVVVPGAPVTEIEMAARILSRVLNESPSEIVDEQVKRLEAALKAEIKAQGQKVVNESLSSVRRDAVKVLAKALVEATAEQRGKSSKPSPNTIIRRSFDVAAASITLASGTEFVIPVEWIDPIIVLAQGDIDAAIDAQVARFTGPAADSDRTTAANAVRLGVRVASVKSKDEAMKIIRSKLLGPWSDPILFDIDLIKPAVNRNNIQFGGDLAVGYAGKRFGIRVQAGYSSYNLDDGRTLSLTNKFVSSMDFWLTLGNPKTMVDLRTRGEIAYYGTTVVDRDNGSGITFGRESSLNYRGHLSAGVRYLPNNRLALGCWFNVGIQYEVYSPFELATGDQAGLNFSVSGAATLNLQTRIRAQYQLFPEYVALRLQSDLQRFQMARAALGVTVGPMGLDFTGEAETVAQFEWRTRLFVDAEVARFFGFVPGLTLGFDFIHRDGMTTVSTFVPAFGVGIRRTAM